MMLTEAQMLQRLKDFVAGAGSQRQASIKLGVSPQFMVDVLKGRRRVGPTIAGYFGLTIATCYVGRATT